MAMTTTPRTHEQVVAYFLDSQRHISIAEAQLSKSELVAALRDPRTQGRRGSIVWGLRTCDCDDLMPDLVTCVIGGSYEEAQHAVSILEKTNAVLPEGVFDQLLARLRSATTTVDWRREAIDICLDMFEASVQEE
jgi:hypothetical protein